MARPQVRIQEVSIPGAQVFTASGRGQKDHIHCQTRTVRVKTGRVPVQEMGPNSSGPGQQGQ